MSLSNKIIQAAAGVVSEGSGEVVFTSSGTQTFTLPDYVTSISVLLINTGGSGNNAGRGGNGGSLRYTNNIAVSSGQTIEVTINSPVSNEALEVTNTIDVSLSGGVTRSGGGGGSKGSGSYGGGGGGGAGGYSGSGGAGGNGGDSFDNGSQGGAGNGGAGSGGGGGAGSDGSNGGRGGNGGGVGIYGEGSNGTRGSAGVYPGGDGGAGGPGSAGSGQTYGGGGRGSGSDPNSGQTTGALGVCRIIWAGPDGDARSFPSTRVSEEESDFVYLNGVLV